MSYFTDYVSRRRMSVVISASMAAHEQVCETCYDSWDPFGPFCAPCQTGQKLKIQLDSIDEWKFKKVL